MCATIPKFRTRDRSGAAGGGMAGTEAGRIRPGDPDGVVLSAEAAGGRREPQSPASGRERVERPLTEPAAPSSLVAHADFVRRLARHLVGTETDADDVAQ